MKYRITSFIALFFLFSLTINAQLEKLTEKVKEKVDEKIEQKIDKTIDETIDDADNELSGNNKKDVKKHVKKDKQAEIKKQKAVKEEQGDEDSAETKQPEKRAALQSTSKYDFIPGDKILFYDDFADVNIGDFPMNWDTKTSAEIVTLNNYTGKWFKLKGDYSYFAPLIKNLKLPENFTIEFDAVFPEGQDFGLEIYEDPNSKLTDDYYPGKGGTFIGFLQEQVTWKTWIETEDGFIEGHSSYETLELGNKHHFSIWGQKSRLRVYCDEQKMLDVPRGIKNELKLNFLRFSNYHSSQMLLSNIRVAVGSPDMRSRLITEGKFSTNGITFDSGSDKIKPESYSVIKEIAAVLKDNPNVKIKIIGHTDSDGNDVSNMALSKKKIRGC